MLSRIETEGGNEHQQRRFYTDLWHAIQGRAIISDTDGKYADMTGSEKVIRQLPSMKMASPNSTCTIPMRFGGSMDIEYFMAIGLSRSSQ